MILQEVIRASWLCLPSGTISFHCLMHFAKSSSRASSQLPQTFFSAAPGSFPARINCSGFIHFSLEVFFPRPLPNWLWRRLSPAPSSGRRGRRGSGRSQMPAAALAAPAKSKEAVRNPTGSMSSHGSNSLVPRKDEGEDQVCCQDACSLTSFSPLTTMYQ